MDITRFSRAMDITKISTAAIFEKYTTLTAIVTLIRQFNNQFVPLLVQDYFHSKFKQWFEKSSFGKDSFTLIIDESGTDHYQDTNPLFEACQVYLSNKLRSKATRLKGYRTRINDQKILSYQLAHGERFVETLEDGIELVWNFCCENSKGQESSKYFELTFDFTRKDEVLDGYIPSVLLKYYDQMVQMNKEIYLYSFHGVDSWRPVKFKHPFTFDSLALDPELKHSIIDDLDMFIRRKEFYKKVGKAWKRGYLLHGPPGTGKSSLVAAMANYLRFSIYDLQLGEVSSDAILRRLMLSISNKSILVIEDIDCTIGLSRAPPTPVADDDYDSDGQEDDEEEENEHEHKGDQKDNTDNDSKLSLSGLLNFIDGLWSSCGDERIIIFTTNHKERLDPALLRPGRMDMHIHMSYLTIKGFRVLANNYLGVSGEHTLFPEIETLLETANATPAQVAEELIRNEDPDIALASVVDMLKKKSKPCQKTKKVTKKRRIDSIEGNKDENQVVEKLKKKKKKPKQCQKIKKGSKKRRVV